MITINHSNKKKDVREMDSIKLYWDKRFKEKKWIWGEEPSEAAVRTVVFLKKENKERLKILDAGCGYGRDSMYFTAHNHKVIGIDITNTGINMARSYYPDIDFLIGNIHDLSFPNASFDMLFGNFLLHLFIKDFRKKIIKESLRVIKPGGIASFSVASTEDADFGQGQEIEKNCFVNARGIMKYYYSINTIKNEFKQFKELFIEPMLEKHVHDYPHEHKSFLIIARKEGTVEC
jgi:ubiquinone/menaquinone biosynthesis C-methylase UbiE